MTVVPPRSSLRSNFGWLVAERGWRVIVGLGVSVLVTRHLGPENFGILSFAFSLSAIFGAIVGFGIDDVLARDLVRAPANTERLLLTGLRIKALGAALAFPVALAACWIFRSGDWAALVLVAWVTASLFFIPADVVELWYQSRERMRAPALIRQGALTAAAFVRVSLVITNAPLWCFAAAVTVEMALVAAGFAVLWLREGKPDTERQKAANTTTSADRIGLASRLLSEGFPLLVSAFLVVLTMHSDRLLLIELSGEKAAGIYAAAARMTELFYILPVALGASFLPRLATLHQSDWVDYARTARKAGLALVVTTIVVAVAITVVAPTALPLLLGEAYRPAADVWKVHVWTLVFVSIVSLRSRLWVVEGRTHWIMAISAVTVVLNISANIMLIPRYGAIGAAWASVFAWGFSAVVLPWCAPGPARSMLAWCGLAKPA